MNPDEIRENHMYIEKKEEKIALEERGERGERGERRNLSILSCIEIGVTLTNISTYFYDSVVITWTIRPNNPRGIVARQAEAIVRHLHTIL